MAKPGSLRGHHQGGDTKNQPKFALDNCVNCDQQLLSVCSSETETSIGSGVVAFTSYVKNVKTQVVMREALKEIYSVLNAIDVEKELKNCALCVDCSLVFAQLFGLFQTFKSRRKPKGVLDVAVTKGIKRALEFVKTTGESAPAAQTEQTVQNDIFASEFKNSAGGPSDDANNCDDMQIDSEINASADLITVQSIPSPEKQMTDDTQRADDMDDANWISDLDNEEDLFANRSPGGNISDLNSVDQPLKVVARSAMFAPEARKTTQTAVDSHEKDIKDKGEESKHVAISSNSKRHHSDGDKDVNDCPPVVVTNDRKRGKGTESCTMKNVTYKCADCLEEFYAIAILAKHRENFHSTSEIYKCHICHRNFRAGFNLTTHLLRHEKTATKASEGDRIFKCIDCGERFSSAAEFGRHRISLHGAVKNPYVCHICLYNCKYQTLLKPHIIRHISTEEHKCSECSSVYKVYTDLKDHMLQKHDIVLRKNHNLPLKDPSKKVVINCRKCGAGFQGQAKFLEHSTTAHGNKLFPCEICQQIFLNKGRLSVHLIKHGKPEKKCQFCDIKFHTSDGRSYHEQYAHQEVWAESRKLFSDPPLQVPKTAGTFQCAECPLTFDTELELSAHISCRHKEKACAVNCDVCGKPYPTRDGLRCHQRKVHGHLKCPKCQETVQGGQLAAHLAQVHQHDSNPSSR